MGDDFIPPFLMDTGAEQITPLYCDNLITEPAENARLNDFRFCEYELIIHTRETIDNITTSNPPHAHILVTTGEKIKGKKNTRAGLICFQFYIPTNPTQQENPTDVT